MNITPDMAELLYQGAVRFIEKEKKKRYKAYLATLNEFFATGFTIDSAGNRVPVLPPDGAGPAFHQFMYYYKLRRSQRQQIIGIRGERFWNLNHRAAVGSTLDLGAYPGFMYQFDMTGAPAYLLSSLRPTQVVGQPNVYIVRDVYSRLITGYAISWEAENWVGCMMALENAFVDKVAHCAKYGIHITHEDWAASGLPVWVLADRGGMWSLQADQMVRGMGVNVTNVASGRADLKGLSECGFVIIKRDALDLAPGAYDETRERGASDHRLEAALDLYALHRVVILTILHYNRSHQLKDYYPDEGILHADIPPFPSAYWRWGVEHRGGVLRTADPEFVRHNLMPTATATVTDKGISFEKLLFTCERAKEEGWFDRKLSRPVSQVQIGYDPRNLGEVYLRTDGGRSVERCVLTDGYRLFAGRSMDEVRSFFRDNQESTLIRAGEQVNADAAHLASIGQEFERSKAARAAAVEETGVEVSVADMNAHRRTERNAQRRAESWVDTAPPLPLPSASPPSPLGVRPDRAKLFDTIREESQQ